MKNITLSITLLICSLGYSQTTLGYFTERAVTATVPTQNHAFNDMIIDNAFADAGTDGGSTVIEAKASGAATNYQAYLNYPGSPNQDLSSYDTYHISLKSTSPQATVIRLEDAASGQVNFDPLTYGFAYDGNWHQIVIPFSDMTAQNSSFNFSDVNNVFMVKSTPGAGGDVVSATYIFYIDDVYFSSGVLSTKSFETEKISLYPNPASTEISIKSKSEVDSVVIYNITGQKVLEFNTTKNLNISSLKTGMYFINTTSKGSINTSKFIKK